MTKGRSPHIAHLLRIEDDKEFVETLEQLAKLPETYKWQNVLRKRVEKLQGEHYERAAHVLHRLRCV